MNPLGLTCAQLADQVVQRYGKGAFYAASLYRAFFSTADPGSAMMPTEGAGPRLREGWPNWCSNWPTESGWSP